MNFSPLSRPFLVASLLHLIHLRTPKPNRPQTPNSQPPPYAMAEAFLTRLPTVGRGVLAKEDQQCPICMEEYGTMPSTTGIFEHAVRLPCHHIVGSECISLWLTPSPPSHSKNTCPLCRHIFFEISPSDTESHDDDDHASHMQIHVSLRRQIETLGPYLLSVDATEMAAEIADRIHDRGPMGDRSLVEISAASLYMASHAMAEPNSLRAISREIAAAGMGDVRIHFIRRTYNWLYQYRRSLIRESVLERFTGLTLDTVDTVLP